MVDASYVSTKLVRYETLLRSDGQSCPESSGHKERASICRDNHSSGWKTK
ncbi:hypothetical protein Pan258_20590 [Symmachiella dynata]|nr:hypothetical protein Pan258_20590 [Symmachiella dynata]